jgi:hypothetical protein
VGWELRGLGSQMWHVTCPCMRYLHRPYIAGNRTVPNAHPIALGPCAQKPRTANIKPSTVHPMSLYTNLSLCQALHPQATPAKLGP